MTPPPTMAEARAALLRAIAVECVVYARSRIAPEGDQPHTEAALVTDAALDTLVAAAQQEERERLADEWAAMRDDEWSAEYPPATADTEVWLRRPRMRETP